MRKVVVMPRTGQAETLFFTWLNGRFDLTKEPQAVVNVGTDANRNLTKAIGPGLPWQPGKYLRASALTGLSTGGRNGPLTRLIRKSKNRWFLQAVAVSEFMETQTLPPAASVLPR